MDERESGRGAEWGWCERTRQKQNSGQSEEVWHGSIAYGVSREISCCAWRGRERARGLLEEELGVRLAAAAAAVALVAVSLVVESVAAVSLELELLAVRLSGELESAAAQPRSSMPFSSP